MARERLLMENRRQVVLKRQAGIMTLRVQSNCLRFLLFQATAISLLAAPAGFAGIAWAVTRRRRRGSA